MPEQTLNAYELMADMAAGATCLALIVGGRVFVKLGTDLKSIVILILFCLATDIILWSDISEETGGWVSRSFTLVEFILISFFFYVQTRRKIFRRIIVTFVSVFPLLVLFDAFSQAEHLRDDLVVVCESAILLGYSVATLYQWMNDMQYKSITTAPQFWIVSAILIYFGGNIFVFGSSNYAYSVSREAFNFVWTIQASVSLIYYMILTFGFWKARAAYR